MIRPAIVRLMAAMGFLLGFPGDLASAWEPIRAHPQNPYIMEFRGKPTLLRTFAYSYSTLIDVGLPYIPYLDVLERDGMNLTQMWCLGFPPDDAATPTDFLQPWPRSSDHGNALDGAGKWDFSHWNQVFFDRLMALAQASSDRGIVIEFTLFSTFYGDEEWEAGPFHPLNNVQGYGPDNWNDTLRDVPANQQLMAVQEAAVRRIVRELNGFDNVYLNIQNEPFWNEPGVHDSQEVDFHNGMLAAIRDEESTLPNRHMVAHNFPQNLATLSSGFDMLNEHYPAAVPSTTIAGAEALLSNHYSLGKILALDETNTETALQARLEAWMFLIGGGGIYDGLDANGAVYTAADPSGDNPLGNTMREAVRNIGSYMDPLYLLALRRDLMWVRNGIPSGATLQASATTPSHQYVAYLHHGQSGGTPYQVHYDPIDTSNHTVSLQVNLPAGDWRAVWTRPSDLAELHVQEFTHNGGDKTLDQVIYQADVALRIDRIVPPPPPSGLVADSNGDGSISLSWDTSPIPFLAGYHVYRSSSPGVPSDEAHRIAVLGLAATGFTDHPVVTNATYYYVVTAVDQVGNEVQATFETSADSVFPRLKIFVDATGQHVLEWTTAFPGWVLQESPDLSSGSWQDSPLIPEVDGDFYQVEISITPGSRFFRLVYRPPSTPLSLTDPHHNHCDFRTGGFARNRTRIYGSGGHGHH